jgi:hypothetical protein
MAAFFVHSEWELPDQVGTLPIVTKVTFQITPGAFADEGIRVQYVLHSSRAQFQDGAHPPALLEEERKNSVPMTPDLVPSRRSPELIVDRYPTAKPGQTTSITRAVCLSEVPHPSTGIATLTVTVSDLTFGGVPTGPAPTDVLTVTL